MTAISSWDSRRARSRSARSSVSLRVVDHRLRRVDGAGVGIAGDADRIEDPLNEVEQPSVLLCSGSSFSTASSRLRWLAAEDAELNLELLVDLVDQLLVGLGVASRIWMLTSAPVKLFVR